MRSRNYSIKELDRHKVKGIAGKIIPAIATTTSLVSGLVTLELYKLFSQTNRTIEDYKNYYVNLGISTFQNSEPAPAKKTKIGKLIYTLWDSFEFKDPTLQEVIEVFESKYGLSVSGFAVGQLMLLSSFTPLKKQVERKKMKFGNLYKELSGEPLAQSSLTVSVIVEDDENPDESDTVELPTIKIILK
jgi:ubiquitin-activating enzyme E1